MQMVLQTLKETRLTWFGAVLFLWIVLVVGGIVQA